jgi:hypothetical protein
MGSSWMGGCWISGRGLFGGRLFGDSMVGGSFGRSRTSGDLTGRSWTDGRRISERSVRGTCFIRALVVVVFAVVPGIPAQQAPPAAGATDPKLEPAKVGSYSLVVTTLEPTAAIHFLNPPPSITVKPGTKLTPAETTGNLPVPPQYTIEALGRPKLECQESAPQQDSAPQQHGCDSLDRTDLTIRDLNTVEYRVRSHGAAVELHVNLEVHDLLPVSSPVPSPGQSPASSVAWHTNDVIFVSVPKATPAYRFVSETLVGEWKGQPIVFEPGKPLPESAKKGLDDLGVHQDLGDAVLYSYRVK